MAQRYDAVIIGGGHNGLTTAAYLAKAGRQTPVPEERPTLGGATESAEIGPGHTFRLPPYVAHLLRPAHPPPLGRPRHATGSRPLAHQGGLRISGRVERFAGELVEK